MKIKNLFTVLMLLAGLVLSVGPTPVAQAAGIVVNSSADVIADDGQCTLREAVIAANTNTASGSTGGECAAGEAAPTVDEITFTDLAGSPDLYTLTIAGTGEDAAATGDLDITEALIIRGNGQTETVIQANGIDRVFEVFADATFEGVTIRHGWLGGPGGGIYNHNSVALTDSTVSNNSSTDHNGGGICNGGGTLILTDSTVSDNSAKYDGGGIFNGGGTLILTGSTVSGNSIHYGGRFGGGICTWGGTAILTNSTVSGNSANGYGGGISFDGDGEMTLTNSTVSGNSGNPGGGIYTYQGPVNLSNTIVADQLGGGDCGGSGFISHGYNLDSDGSCQLTQLNDKPGANANLGPLQLNAPGNTATHALLPGSEAIDAGNDAVCAADPVNGLDQRGVTRPQPAGGHCDIGAYELEYISTITIVKDAIPDDEQDFDFELEHGGQVMPFYLDDDDDPTLSNTETIEVMAGLWSLSEASMPAGWTLDDITCVTNDTVNPPPAIQKPVVEIALDPDEEVTCTFTNKKEPPTAITMPSSSFLASGQGGWVTVAWQTETELDNAGFNVYRGLSNEGPWMLINEALIPAKGDAFTGASYSFQDVTGFGTFYYQLEAVDLNGATSIHGPIAIDMGAAVRAPRYRPLLPNQF